MAIINLQELLTKILKLKMIMYMTYKTIYNGPKVETRTKQIKESIICNLVFGNTAVGI